jgi:hypothetical protein
MLLHGIHDRTNRVERGVKFLSFGHQVMDFDLPRFERPDEVVQDACGVQLAEQVLQAFFRNRTDIGGRFAVDLRADYTEKALFETSLSRGFADPSCVKKPCGGSAPKKRQPSGFGGGTPQGVESKLGGFVGHAALLGRSALALALHYEKSADSCKPKEKTLSPIPSTVYDSYRRTPQFIRRNTPCSSCGN